SMKPQDSLVETIGTTVPVGGRDRYRPPENIIELVQARLAAGRTLVNPIAMSPESLTRGGQMYKLHCLVCHGSEGRGDGPVGKKFVPQPMELNLDYVQLQPDGQLFYTISHGSFAMPFYRQAMPADDRWHLVNFIKEVFGES
ncbi:MAG: cytochrome c, partial [Lysobacterales bacterium]